MTRVKLNLEIFDLIIILCVIKLEEQRERVLGVCLWCVLCFCVCTVCVCVLYVCGWLWCMCWWRDKEGTKRRVLCVCMVYCVAVVMSVMCVVWKPPPPPPWWWWWCCSSRWEGENKRGERVAGQGETAVPDRWLPSGGEGGFVGILFYYFGEINFSLD